MVIVVIALVLLITGSTGCLGGQQQTQKKASEIILTASEIPGTWWEGGCQASTPPAYTSDYADKHFWDEVASAYVLIRVCVYESESKAREVYQYGLNNFTYLTITHPDIGDEAFMYLKNTGTSGGSYMVISLREGLVNVAAVTGCRSGSTISEQWFIDLVRTQVSRI